MTSFECPHEEDVQAAVDTGRWPGRVNAELSQHVAACETCQDVVAVASAFREVEIDPSIRVPDASAVWLRAQVRTRAEATRLAERPITIAQAVAFASVVGVLGVLVGAASPWLQTLLHWTAGALAYLLPTTVPVPEGVSALVAAHVGMTIAAACLLLLTPVAVYWATREN